MADMCHLFCARIVSHFRGSLQPVLIFSEGSVRIPDKELRSCTRRVVADYRSSGVETQRKGANASWYPKICVITILRIRTWWFTLPVPVEAARAVVRSAKTRPTD